MNEGIKTSFKKAGEGIWIFDFLRSQRKGFKDMAREHKEFGEEDLSVWSFRNAARLTVAIVALLGVYSISS